MAVDRSSLGPLRHYDSTMNEALQAALLEMRARDQRARLELPPRDHADFPTARDALLSLDAAHTAQMKAWIARHGWLGFETVGRDGATAAWLIVQHADADREFQQACLELLRHAVARGDADAGQLAFLTDRVRVGQGRPQVYGTQTRVLSDGSVEPFEIEDADRVDERRLALGLNSLVAYLESMKR